MSRDELVRFYERHLEEREDEVATLEKEVKVLKEARALARQQAYEEAMESRKAPPLQQFTRQQKRGILEPWMSTAAVVAGTIATAGYLIGIFVHMDFAMVGLVFTVLTAIAVGMKLYFMDQNERLEGRVERY